MIFRVFCNNNFQAMQNVVSETSDVKHILLKIHNTINKIYNRILVFTCTHLTFTIWRPIKHWKFSFTHFILYTFFIGYWIVKVNHQTEIVVFYYEKYIYINIFFWNYIFIFMIFSRIYRSMNAQNLN